MSKFILAYYSSDFGMDMDIYNTEQEAFDGMIRYIEDRNGMFTWETEDGDTLYQGDCWANCYGHNGNEEHCSIFTIW